VELAKKDSEWDVQVAAVDALVKHDAIIKVIRGCDNSILQIAALNKLSDRHVLEDIAANESDTWTRIAAAGMIGDQSTLVEIANGDNEEYEFEEAVRKPTDPLALKEVASKCKLVDDHYMAFTGLYSTARFSDDVDKTEFILDLIEHGKDIIVMFKHNFYEKLYRLLTV